METLHRPPPRRRPSRVLAATLLALPALTVGTSALAQGASLRWPGAAVEGPRLGEPGGAWAPWASGTALLALDASLGADYRIAPFTTATGLSVAAGPAWLPRISVGLQQPAATAGGLAAGLRGLDAQRGGSADLVLGASRSFLDQSLLVRGALRSTQGGGMGLPGFDDGGTSRGSRTWQPEVGVAWLLRKDLAIGAEYRFRSGGNAGSSLLGDHGRDDDAKDVYLAWAPRRDVSLTFGWADQGRSGGGSGLGITPRRSLTGFYVAGQVAF